MKIKEELKKVVPDLDEKKLDLIQKYIDTIVSRIATDVEADIKTLTNIEKNADEKYYDYYKRAVGLIIKSKEDASKEIGTLKEKLEKTKGGNPEEIKKLKDKIKELEKGNVNLSELKDKLTGKDNLIKEFEQKIKDIGETHKTELEKLNSEYSTSLKEVKIGSVLNTITLPKTMSDKMKLAITNNIKNELSKFDLVEENGKIILKDGEKTVYDKDNPVEIMTADKLITNELKDYGIENGKTIFKNDGSGGKVNTGIIGDAKTRDQAYVNIREYLKEKGIDEMSDNFNSEMSKIAKETGAFDLPLNEET